MIYCDIAYIAKCYLNEQGSDEARSLVKDAGRVECCGFGLLELPATTQRNLLEGKIPPSQSRSGFQNQRSQRDYLKVQSCTFRAVSKFPCTAACV